MASMSLNHLLLPCLLTLGALGQVPLAEFSTNRVCQAFLPDKIARVLGSTVDESVWEPVASTRSMPFAPGYELMAVHRIP